MKKPTRETIDTSSIIDHIAINIASNVIESGVLKLGLGDYYLVYAIPSFAVISLAITKVSQLAK